jgi:1-phosphofructokinase
MSKAIFDLVVTVSLSPAIDRVLEVPDFKIGGHQKGRLLSRTPAGKAINVSRALARLGVKNTATGFVGYDQLEMFETFLEESDVQSQLLAVDERTRVNITLVDPNNNVETHIRDVGFHVGDADLTRLRKKLNLLCSDRSLVVFSGSCPPGIEARQFASLIAMCVQSGAKVAVDTSGDPLRAVRDKPLWLAKPNTAELADLAGRPLDDEQIIQTGLDLSDTYRALIVSRGEAGGYLFIDRSALVGHVPVARERIRNTVGCGDCLLAGFVAAQMHGKNVRDSYRHAIAVATAAACSLGPADFDLDDVAEFEQAAGVEPLNP